MTYAETIQFLYDLGFFGSRFGLETTRALAASVGNPQDKLRFIHVAGTNGKGSTCAMLESIYRAAGLRVGLFTSPHLVSFRERIQVNRQLISEADAVRLVADLRAKMSSTIQPTLFELTTVMALRYFAEQRCDLVIWETGLGGRLDATNTVTPLASVITNIALDHQQWLGDTLEKIAAEKAGIIKQGIPVITAVDAPEALEVIEQIAKANVSPLTRVHASRITHHASLLGDHQKLNATLAIATIETLQNQIPISTEAIRTGLENVQWQGRLQLITRSSGQKILLDGAHNVAGTKALVVALEQLFPDTKPALILGILQDKDWRHICEMLSPLAARILLVPVQSDRTTSPHELAEVCRRANPALRVTEPASFSTALDTVANDPFVVVTGSLYLVGEALALLKPTAESAGERGLNEWNVSPPHSIP